MNLGFKKADVYEEVIGENKSKFHFYPLERGYGRTLGNDLRRVLLSSIPGTAIIGMKIEGINHEFQNIAGTVNNGTELIINLKQMDFSLEEEGMVEVKFKAKKAGTYYAKDISLPSGVTCNTPNIELLKLNGEQEVDITLYINTGRGYVDSEVHVEFASEEYKEVIKIDADYKPVKVVAIETESMRVGHDINFEKLFLEIETNGVITPKEALTIAQFIIKSHMEYIVDMKEYVEEMELLEDEKQKEEEIFEAGIETLNLSVRPYNCLKNKGYDTIGKVLSYSREQLLGVENLGKNSLVEIEEKLALLGYKLRD